MALKTCTKSGWYIGVKLTKITSLERTFMASWSCNWAHVDNYEVFWRYGLSDKSGKPINKYIDTTHNVKHISNNATYQDTFNYPENATWVQVWVRPHEAEDGKYWKYLCPWSPYSKDGQGVWQYVYDYKTPGNIPTPTIEVDRYKVTVTASIDTIDYDKNASHVQFYVVDKTGNVVKKVLVAIDRSTSTATYSFDGGPGQEYKASARGYNKALNIYGEWSSYSSTVLTSPVALDITDVRAVSSTSVEIFFSDPRNAAGESVEIRYTTNENDFLSDSGGQSMTVDVIPDVGSIVVEGLETGKKWFFACRVLNDSGSSRWSYSEGITLGLKADPPTTWSNAVTARIGDIITLNWVHNTRDGSHMSSSEIEITVNEGDPTTITVPGVTDTEINDYKDTGKYELDTTSYTDGSKIRWRIRTKGIIDTYSDWSITREIKVYAPTTMSVKVSKSPTGEALETLDSFPLYVIAEAGPPTQKANGFHISILADQPYQKTDYNGERVWVGKNEAVYSHFFDFDALANSVSFDDYATVENNVLTLKLMPQDVDFESGQSYTIQASVSTNVGLSADSQTTMSVYWEDQNLYPQADVSVDMDDFTATIIPYAPAIPDTPDGMADYDDQEGDGNLPLLDDVLLSVYRVNYDGTTTLILDGIDNNRSHAVVDPHPALDYARYRVVAIHQGTGSVGFKDVDPVKVGQPGIVIQWDEDWRQDVYTNPYDGQKLEGVSGWSGMMLTLPYNVDSSESSKPDRATVEYVGQEHPTSYFGTQLGETASWSSDIEMTDTERLALLRKLRRYQGNVYVRNSRGIGYWAVVEVSYNIGYGTTMIIPVSVNVTRVRGGV